MKTLNDINFSGEKVIMRVDFNVPLNDAFEVTDSTRIKAAIPSIQKILADGGSVILMSHLGRPKSGPEDKFSLKHIIPALEKELGQAVQFADDCIGESAKEKSESLQAKEVLLLENLRFYSEETAGDKDFAEKLSKLATFYVNDAFGTAHRAHASTAIIAQFFPSNKCFGFLMENEIKSVQKILTEGKEPITAIIGGAKVSSKISIITNLLDKIDRLIIGGGMAFTFIKASGGEIGTSLVEEDFLQTALDVLREAKAKNVEVFLPTDAACADAFSNDANRSVHPSDQIPEGWMGLDAGPNSIEELKAVVLSSKTILWNGPLGVFEFSNFAAGTKEVGKAIAESTEAGAFSLVGGGDSVAATNQLGLADKMSYISTGGGALLEYLEGRTLPGIQAILD